MKKISKLVCILFICLGSSCDLSRSDKTETEHKLRCMQIEISGYSFVVELQTNETVNELIKLFPMTIEMDELNGNEIYHYLDHQLPTDDLVPDKIEAGDVMLYGSDCLVIFYESFKASYSYTPIGHIKDVDRLKALIESDEVFVEWTIE